MNDRELKITPETARDALYRLDGTLASDDGMIIENALTLWEEEREESDRLNEIIYDMCQKEKEYRKALEYYATRQHFMNYEDGVTARKALGTSHDA